MTIVADGFLGRWSQRKQDLREGKSLLEPAPKPAVSNMAVSPAVATVQTGNQAANRVDETVTADKPEIALPTMEDVHKLTADSDFAPFVARNVSPEVRNTAMKKLFTDPHYNVMDKLDIYIDDYSKPDPLPVSMIRQMAGAKFLNLFNNEDEEEKKSAEQAILDADTKESEQEPKQAVSHDHTDLRLQQDYAAEPHQLGRSAE